MTDNLAIWSALAKTDPAHTKKFVRGGGFRGTSVKPIYTDQKMTQQFGPCGIGWGITEPTYQTVPTPEGEVAVFCWLSVWYVSDGKKSEPIPGVGGDFVIKKTSKGLTPDDEAFKKASTDAIGNAMKHIGMSADIHMGQHDDDKYVAELEREIREEAAGNGAPAPRQPVTDHGPKPPPPRPTAKPEAVPSDWVTLAQDIERAVKACRTDRAVDLVMGEYSKALAAMKQHDPGRYSAVGAMVVGHRASLQQPTAVAG